MRIVTMVDIVASQLKKYWALATQRYRYFITWDLSYPDL